jgi:predicted lipoprotein with Yx(FWY)xxD motif
MKPVTFRGRIVNLWDTSVGWLAAFIIMGSIAGCAYLFLAPATANSSPIPTTKDDATRNPNGQASPPADLKVIIDAKYGKILVNADGHALYRRDTDPPNQATCTNACATMWPPATVTATPVAGTGIDTSKLTTIAGSNGTQLTFAGHPLYQYAKDLDLEDRYGEGAFQVWWLVGPDGQEITAAAHTTAKPATKAGSGY